MPRRLGFFFRSSTFIDLKLAHKLAIVGYGQSISIIKMHLMYTADADGKRTYTLKKVQGSEVTKSAHPARFSPDDKYSRSVEYTQDRNHKTWRKLTVFCRHRVTLKKRYGLLLTQQSELKCLNPLKPFRSDRDTEDQKVLGQ